MQIRKLWSALTLIVGILLILPFQKRADAKESLGVCLLLIRTYAIDPKSEGAYQKLERELARLSGIMDGSPATSRVR